MFVGVRGTVVITVDGPIGQINPWEGYRSMHKERRIIYGRIVLCRSSAISNWSSDRSCSPLGVDISLMRPLNHDEHAC